MIKKEIIETYLEEILEGGDVFLVEVKVDQSSRIRVHIDKKEGVSIDNCVEVSRALEAKMDRDEEDYALEVSSPGLDSPFKVEEQYEKSIGKMVSVQLKDGIKLLGILKKASGEKLSLEVPSGKKGVEPDLQELSMEEIISTRLHVQF